MASSNAPSSDAYLHHFDREIEELMVGNDPALQDEYEALLRQQRHDFRQRTEALADEARDLVFGLVACIIERGVDPAIQKRIALDAETVADRLAATIRMIREELF